MLSYLQKITRLLVEVFVAVFVFGFIIGAQAEEVIHSFSSNVTLRLDGAVEVVEIIEVEAEGSKIKRGIYRDILSVMKNDDGSDYNSKLEIISVKKNGIDEPYHIKDVANGKRVYFGQSDVFLEHGRYKYEISYVMSRQVRFFADHDELYWNATGNFWDFPILKSVAQITLPSGANISELVAYTGALGSTEQAVKITKTSENSAIFRATRSLNAYEGMSVALKFQKGIIVEPDGVEAAKQFVSDRLGTIIPLLVAFLILFYYLYAWFKVGRDPDKGIIIPLFYPPKNFSPALTHFVWKMGWKKDGWTAFSAALVNLAVKELITIDKKKKGKTKISLTDKHAVELPHGEQVIYEYIASKKVVILDKSNGPKLDATRKEFIKLIGSENRQAYFKNNFIYSVFGLLLSFICLGAMMVGGFLNPTLGFFAMFGGVVIGLFITAFSGLWSGVRLSRFFLIVWLAGIFFNATGSVSIFIGISAAFSVISFIAVISIVIINIVFVIIMRAPTVHGRKIMNEIDGFRLYLEVAEKERMNMASEHLVGEPEMSVKRFETLLPYAIALGVEKPWAQYFESELARNAISDVPNGYNPTWVTGSGFSPSNIGTDMAALATGMSASMMAAQAISSSSSGFSRRSSGGGGGGFSGGGGGGGGGGGW